MVYLLLEKKKEKTNKKATEQQLNKKPQTNLFKKKIKRKQWKQFVNRAKMFKHKKDLVDSQS